MVGRRPDPGFLRPRRPVDGLVDLGTYSDPHRFDGSWVRARVRARRYRTTSSHATITTVLLHLASLAVPHSADRPDENCGGNSVGAALMVRSTHGFRRVRLASHKAAVEPIGCSGADRLGLSAFGEGLSLSDSFPDPLLAVPLHVRGASAMVRIGLVAVDAASAPPVVPSGRLGSASRGRRSWGMTCGSALSARSR